MSTFTHKSFFPALQAALPEFVAASPAAQQRLADPDYPIFGIFYDYTTRLRGLLDTDNRPDLVRYFGFLNQLLETKDAHLLACIYDNIIEFLALSSAVYYHASLQYLSPFGVALLNDCKTDPPLGVLSPPW
jgi:hypothetical protein